MKKLIQSLFIWILLNSCVSLTKTQVESVNQFGQTTKDFSTYPSKIMTELADIRVKRGLFYANSLSNPKLHIEELDSIYSQNEFEFTASKKVDISLKIIDKYSQSLVLLSSNQFSIDIEKQAQNFGGNIDSLITIYNTIGDVSKIQTGIGTSIGRIVVLGGKQYVKSRQAIEIKKFVFQADTLIGAMTTNLLDNLQSADINDLIDNEEQMIHRNYLSFLQQSTKASIETDTKYLELKNSIDRIRILKNQTVETTKDLRDAHKKLLQEIQNKKDLNESIKELQGLFERVKELKGIIKNFEKK